MSDLIVIGYDDPVQARSAYDEAMAMETDFIANLSGVAIVAVDAEGKSHVETRRGSSGWVRRRVTGHSPLAAWISV